MMIDNMSFFIHSNHLIFFIYINYGHTLTFSTRDHPVHWMIICCHDRSKIISVIFFGFILWIIILNIFIRHGIGHHDHSHVTVKGFSILHVSDTEVRIKSILLGFFWSINEYHHISSSNGTQLLLDSSNHPECIYHDKSDGFIFSNKYISLFEIIPFV